MEKGEKKEVSKLTDRIFLGEMNNCFAGEKSLTIGPDGNFYICPAFYYDNMLKKDYDINQIIELTYLNKAPICNNCDAYQCNRCIYMNIKFTGEYNTPSKLQCETSHIDRKVSQRLLKNLHDINMFIEFHIPDISYFDPIEGLEESYNRK